jgi:hypothetical protein
LIRVEKPELASKIIAQYVMTGAQHQVSCLSLATRKRLLRNVSSVDAQVFEAAKQEVFNDLEMSEFADHLCRTVLIE